MAKDANVKVVLTANDQASGPIKNLQNTLGGLKGSMGGANQMAGVLAGGLAGIAASVGIDALQELGGAMMDLGRQAESFGMLRQSFDGLAAGVGQSSEQMLSAMKAASGGMIADQELILAANRAMMLGVADSSAEMGQLLEVAAVRGRAMGLSTSQAFNDLVTGLGRMSPLILDNLGIVTGGEKVFEDYAKSIGTTAAALTDAERKQALLNKVISETDTSGEVMVSQFERMDAAISNAKVALGELFGPAISQIAQNLADAVTEVTDAMTTDQLEAAQGRLWAFGDEVLRLAQEMQDLQALSSIAELAGDTSQFAKLQEDLANVTTRLGVYVDNYNEAAAITGAPLIDPEAIKSGEIAMMDAAAAAAYLGQTEEGTAQRTEQLKAAMTLASYASASMASGLSQVQAQAGATMGVIYNLTGAINQLNAVTGVMRANSDLLSELTPQINGITSGLMNNLGVDEALAKGEELKIQTRQQIEDLREQGYTTDQIRLILQSNVQETQAWASEFDKVASSASDVEDEIKSAIESLQGRVQGALEDAISLDVDWPGKDGADDNRDINENARRMAAIANEGLIGQDWLGDFAAEAPAAYADLMLKIAAGADAKSAAQSIMQDFQAGLRPDMLNLDALKEDIKQQIAGETAMAATAAKITAELVADTGGDSADIQKKVNKALGLGVASTELTDGILGQLNSATFTGQLNTAAGGAGKQWGTSFLSYVEQNVPPQLVALLVNLVTPGVQANIQQQDSQTGPVE